MPDMSTRSRHLVAATVLAVAYLPRTAPAQPQARTAVKKPPATQPVFRESPARPLAARASHPRFAQAGPPVPGAGGGKTEKKDSRPPVPPGVPTTVENVHLPTEGEVRLGREGSVEIEKEYKVVTSGPYHDRLQNIAREVVQAIQRSDVLAEYRRVYQVPKKDDRSKRVPFEFSFKVVDTTKEINAFSLAGGPIYVTKGLMDYTSSDHELGAVLAHECAHVAYHHVEQLVRKQKKINSTQIWGLLAAVIAGGLGGGAAASAAGNVLMAGQLVSIATLTGYGRELEHEADRIGVRAMSGTKYHPLGMLTFMQKLARDDRLRGNPELRAGIFQSHPYSNERVAAIRKEVEALGYRADTGAERQVSGDFRVVVSPHALNGKEAAELRLAGTVLYVVAAGEDGLTAPDRAHKIARQIEALFADNLTYNDVRQSPDKTALLLKGIPVIRVLPEDAAAAGTPAAATERAYNAIMRALLREQLTKPF